MSEFIRKIAGVASLSLLSRFLGILREVFLSHFAGATILSDAVVIALKIPNLFKRFFSEGAMNAAIIPQYAKLESQKGTKYAERMSQQVFSFFFWFFAVFVGLVLLNTYSFFQLIMPGLSHTPERLEQVVSFSRIIFPYILVLSLTAVMSAVLNANNYFAAAAFTPSILNIVVLINLVFVYLLDWNVAISLCYAIIIAGIIQFVWLYSVCIYRGLKFKILEPSFSREIRQIMADLFPTAIAAGVMQINLMVSIAMAASLPTGSITYLYYADRFHQLPISVLGGAISTVLLPSMAKKWRQGHELQASKLQEHSLEIALYMSLPLGVFLFILAKQLISFVYGHGKFSHQDVQTTADTLKMFALGVPGYVMGKVILSTLFARREIRKTTLLSIFCIATNFILSLIFMRLLGHIGLALSISLSTTLTTFLSAFVLYKIGGLPLELHFLRKVLSIVCCSCLLGCSLHLGSVYFFYPNLGKLFQFAYILGAIVSCTLLYKIFSRLARINPMKSFRASENTTDNQEF